MRSIYFLFLVWTGCAGMVRSQTLPGGFSKQSLATGISRPTVLVFAPDGRLFVCEQAGKIKVFKNGAMLTTPFAQLTVDSQGERGLLGLAFDPDYVSNGHIYVYYTNTSSPRRNRLSRLTSNPANPDVMLAGSESVVLEFDPLSSATNHNGGFIEFGADGKLYVAIGDNAAAANSQNYHTHLGHLLRLNADGSAPADNPFFTATPNGSTPTPASQRTWALGLRNPYSFAIAPASGKIFVNDVGGNRYEEINDATAGGQNFGWPTQEGPPKPGFDGPAYYYGNNSHVPNSDSSGCSVLGGAFLISSATNYPARYRGKYFFMDYCNGWFRYIDPAHTPANGSALFATGFGFGLVSLATGPDGNLYYLHRGAGSLERIVYTPPLIESVASGQWNDPATWSCACVPTFTDEVIVRAGHSVLVDGVTALARNVALDGGQVQVMNNGTLRLHH